jgi:hypothetical protein
LLRVGLPGRPLAGTRVTLLTVRNDAGRGSPLKEEDESIEEVNSTDRQSVKFGIPLKVPEHSKWVDVTLAVQRTRTVEFLASPTRPPQIRTPRSSAGPR